MSGCIIREVMIIASIMPGNDELYSICYFIGYLPYLGSLSASVLFW